MEISRRRFIELTGLAAISISTGATLSSITLYDDKGDGIFRRKYKPFEVFNVPGWILRKYAPKSKT